MVATWNDYGEGTSIEPGIDNCVDHVSGTDAGCDTNHQCTLNWSTVFSDTTNGTEHTIADYRIDEVNMITGQQNLGIATIFPDGNGNFQTHSFTYADTTFGCDEWFYVTAVGLNSVTNHKSNSVDVHCSSGSLSISGTEQSNATWQSNVVCNGYWDPDFGCSGYWEDDGWYVYTYDTGSVTATAMGLTKTVSYGQASTKESIAADIANAFNADPNSQVQASVNGAIVSFRSKHLGPTYNQPLGSSWTWDSGNFSSSSFTVSTSGLQGGAG